MSAQAKQNSYTISILCDSTRQAEDVARFQEGIWQGETWQDAIHNILADYWYKGWDVPYQVISETSSVDDRSGIMEIKETQPGSHLAVNKIQATIIEND